MAMSATLLPSCSQALHLQQRQRILSIGGTECKGQRGPAWGLNSGLSLQGVRLTNDVPPVQFGLSTKRRVVVRAEQLEAEITTASPIASELNVGGITEVCKDLFWPIVKSAREKVVVLDMYTQWCGPCKLMLPKIGELAEQLDDVIFLKIDCNQYNKVLAKELGI